jgi:deazaflavin-dependent oxidoreductase (nitroreductase family)
MECRALRVVLRRLIVLLGHITSPITVPIARSGVVPLWGVVHHRGRRSGKEYRTPVVVLGTPAGLLLPLPYGSGTDWCRNLLATGTGVVHWRGADHEVSAPEVIDASTAAPTLSGLMRPLVRVLGIKQFLQVRRAGVGRSVDTHGTPGAKDDRHV